MKRVTCLVDLRQAPLGWGPRESNWTIYTRAPSVRCLCDYFKHASSGFHPVHLN